ncbi:dienelactone hydrolase family protein [Bradyrhizobium sp. GCM10027634]|uniref:dienelactone hydrolase family protein n=1 Tax=unclassified Bradyrhizobium TaxID=2631580 RepID=UPI00188D8072|nr:MULTISPECIES: dienelactone hydrolase family protein [unclassified Bradyrhizobium]MDN5005753.1 dienelactone hydrolase family protein [Bradyrhizobium sp. WYCCWR 12677]QOZ44477.1 carboxymethylenebutenolidase [Bradyrhizobium sp. CCBAU 53340]
MIARRTVLAGLATLLSPIAAHGASGEEFKVTSGGDSLSVSRYAAAGSERRPAVIALHGARGVELKPRAYERYADALTARGIDTYFLRYMTPADMAALTSTSHEIREAYETTRFDGWADIVAATVTAVLGRSDCSGRVGLLGFSLGSYIAAEAAARDLRIAALAALYGGMPQAMTTKIKHMPPLIVLHGEEDRNVPIAEGRQLVALGKLAGAETEFVPYPGKAHGFDFSDTDPMTADAIDRVTKFFEARLAA